MFTHLNNNYNWPKIKRKNINGVRHYVDESDNIYHSVTRVTGILAEEGLKEWRSKDGESKGADAEEVLCKKLGIRIFKSLEDIPLGVCKTGYCMV